MCHIEFCKPGLLGVKMNRLLQVVFKKLFMTNYAGAVLNDGLLMLELRDGIHEGNGNRII